MKRPTLFSGGFGDASKGFTLIEIIIVVVILGILAAVALPKVIENINKAKAAEAFQFMGAMRKALDWCLDTEAGGGPVGPTEASFCGYSTYLLSEGYFVDPNVLPRLGTVVYNENFGYSLYNFPVGSPIVIFAAKAHDAGSQVLSTTDILQISIDVSSNAIVSKTCLGLFIKMCRD